MVMVTATDTEETTMMEGDWEDPPETQQLGQYQGRDPPEQWQEEVQGYRRPGSVDDEIKVRVEVRVRIKFVS